MLASLDRRQITATEIDERKEEKLLALGPVLENFNQDLFDPFIDISFNLAEKQGLLPPPPEELQGAELKVEYISIMAQAQKLVGVSANDRFLGVIGASAQYKEEVVDKIDFDALIDKYGDQLSIQTDIIKPTEEAQKVRQARMQQAQQQAEIDQAQQMAQMGRDLSQAQQAGGEGQADSALDLAESGLF